MGFVDSVIGTKSTPTGFVGSIVQPADAPRAAAIAKYKQEAEKSLALAKAANSPLGIAKETGKGILSFGQDLLKGAAEFGLSAGEAPARVVSPKLSAAALPPVNIPGLSKVTGPLQSFQSKAAQAVQDGESPLKAVGAGFVDTVVNDPLGLALKPIFLGGVVAAKAFTKLAGEKTVQKVVDVLHTSFPSLTPKQVETIAPHIVETSNPKEIQQLVETVQKNIPSETPAPRQVVPNPLAEEARKYKSAEEFISSQQGRFHGTSREIKNLIDDSYSTENIYGQGLYTTDNFRVADGYTRKGGGANPTIYKVKTREGVKVFDLEKSLTAAEKKALRPAFGEYGSMIDKNKTLREAMDEMRDLSSSGEFSADTAQEYFDSIRIKLEELGYAGLRHIGGGKAGKTVHDVQIYFNPSKDIQTTKFSTPKELENIFTEVNRGTGKVSKVAQSMDTKAVEDGLTKSGLSDLAEYTPITIKEQAAKATDLINNRFDEALQILEGSKSLPSDLRAGSFIKAMEDLATKTGDGGLLQKLAKSPLTSETSVHAQELRTLAERNPDSPVNVIRDITKARGSRVKNVETARTKVVSDIQREIKKAATPKTWGEFVDSITC